MGMSYNVIYLHLKNHNNCKNLIYYYVTFVLRCLASLTLPAALEDVKGVGIPQSLVEKSNSIRMNGGVQKLENMIRELPELLKRNEEIINEVIYKHR